MKKLLMLLTGLLLTTAAYAEEHQYPQCESDPCPTCCQHRFERTQSKSEPSTSSSSQSTEEGIKADVQSQQSQPQ